MFSDITVIKQWDRQHKPEPTEVAQASNCPSFRSQRTPSSFHLLSHNIVDKDGPLKKELLRVDWRDTMKLLKETGSLFHLKDIQKPHTYLVLQTRGGFRVRYWSWKMRTLQCPMLFAGWLIQSSPVTIFGFIFEELLWKCVSIIIAWEEHSRYLKVYSKIKTQWDLLFKKKKDRYKKKLGLMPTKLLKSNYWSVVYLYHF